MAHPRKALSEAEMADLTTKAAAWDGAQSSWRKGYERGIRDALELISELRKQYTPASQKRVRFSIYDMDRAFKGGLDLAREDITKLLPEAKDDRAL